MFASVFLLNIVYFSVCLTSNKLYWIDDQLADVSTRFYTSASWSVCELTGYHLHYKQFGKGIVKYNAFKQNFTLFCSTSEPKGVSFTLWIFWWRIFDRHDVLYALGNDKVENDQLPEAVNVLYWFEKVPYLLCWKLGRTLPTTDC